MKLKLQHEGAWISVEAQKIKGKLWIHWDGETFVIEDEGTGKNRKKNSKDRHGGDLLAPMPGKVTKIHKQKGDSVAAGDVVLVMEAMKMEYSLKAEAAGVITAVNCKVGDQVTLGKVLAQIKAEKQNA